MKFNQTTVFLVLFGLLLMGCLACAVKSKFAEAMTAAPVDAPQATDWLGGDFDPAAHPDAKHRSRVKRPTAAHMDRANKVTTEPMVTMTKFGLCAGSLVQKVDEAGTNCYGYCADNAAVYKTDAAGSNCYGYCPDNAAVYKTDAAGTNCYGFCPDNATVYKTDAAGSNCADPPSYTCTSLQGPVRSLYGCCSDGTAKTDAGGTNCAAAATCNYGTCDDGTCKTDAAGSNCGKDSAYTCGSISGPVRSIYGCCSDGSAMTDAGGKNCAAAATCNYGMCTDGTTCKSDTMGSNCSQYPAPLPQTCSTSTYGCCPDNTTSKNESGSNCSPAVVQPTEMAAGIIPFNTSTVFIPPPAPVYGESTPASVPSGSCPEPRPCPACARCPEPAFECKKVPNYERTDNERYVPQAVLTDFSSFGM